MIYIIITSIISAYIINKYLYKICDEISKTNLNTILIYTTILLTSLLIYYKYGITTESLKYLALIPFIILISIIDYHTNYIYDITVLSGIIIQGAIFLATLKLENNAISHITSLTLGFLIPYILAKTKGLGTGDTGVYSLCCFTLGHNYTLYLISLSFILACAYCIYVLVIKSDKIVKIPFAPFISMATILIILTNYDILNIILT
ncbi:prepilin peptidase [Romboutsia sp.]|uniref:prepilin peptidase n=1 Tax=Romboutsia sp. TaxID=1965302 RepID=UPI003F2AE9FB